LVESVSDSSRNVVVKGIRVGRLTRMKLESERGASGGRRGIRTELVGIAIGGGGVVGARIRGGRLKNVGHRGMRLRNATTCLTGSSFPKRGRSACIASRSASGRSKILIVGHVEGS
jgi:hypothetical protein